MIYEIILDFSKEHKSIIHIIKETDEIKKKLHILYFEKPDIIKCFIYAESYREAISKFIKIIGETYCYYLNPDKIDLEINHLMQDF